MKNDYKSDNGQSEIVQHNDWNGLQLELHDEEGMEVEVVNEMMND